MERDELIAFGSRYVSRQADRINTQSEQLLLEAEALRSKMETYELTPEEVRRNFRRLPELPGPEGPKPTIFPRIFAELLARRHADNEDLRATLIYYRLQYSDAVIQNRGYGRWLDRLTGHVENILVEKGMTLSTRLSDYLLVPEPLAINSDPDEKVEDLDDLEF